ncbi:hypothetical protein AB5N19_00195 [Seiridium cardinale]
MLYPNGKKLADSCTLQRERGFETNPYPCIGLYRFTILTLLTHPSYASITSRLKATEGASYLDVGCCFGRDLRQLFLDGVPSQRLTGLDVAGPLMNLGYDLFLDLSTLQSRFVVADVFKGPNQGQIAGAKQLSRLVKKGGNIVGRQIFSVKPGDVPAIREKSVSYRHDAEIFAAMWQQIGEATATRWKVEGTLDMVGINPNSPVEDANSRRLLFTVTRRE